ncbi:MAG: prephenate dehydrogenase/arogenate dehydrogenase family protein [Lautropia sp.]|nr:prephenate dehydrogenase/arogenate dehydrogenase family protein [Lautropia sp.]
MVTISEAGLSGGATAGGGQGGGFRRVAILGTGMLGGSLAAALRDCLPGIERIAYGVEPDLSQAMALGLFDRKAATVAEAVAGADLVVLAAPISVNCALMPDVAAHLSSEAVLTDVSSVKGGIEAAWRQAAGGRAGLLSRFVASHPIAGSEKAGPDAGSAKLFDGRSVVLSALPESSPEIIERLAALWQCLGARIDRMSVADHDRVFAQVSHWPHAMAFALAAAIAADQGAPPAGAHAGSGLLDMTRIAASSPSLWADILLHNREQSLKAADAAREQWLAVEAALRDGDRERLTALFCLGAEWRRQY